MLIHKKRPFLALVFISLTILLTVSICLAAGNTAIYALFSKDIQVYNTTYESIQKNLKEEYKSVEFVKYVVDEDSQDQILADIHTKTPELILTFGPRAAQIAKESIKTVPVVYCIVHNSEKYVAPNITGVTINIPLELKVREVMRMFTSVKKIGMLYSDSMSEKFMTLKKVCNDLNAELAGETVNNPKDYLAKLKVVIQQIDCYVFSVDKIYNNESVKFTIFEGIKNKKVVIGLSSFYTKMGAMISFDTDYTVLSEQTAGIMLKILNGANPSDIEPQSPSKVTYSLNLKTAEAIGINIPPNINKSASVVFK